MAIPRIGISIGSRNDARQCWKGAKILRRAIDEGKVEVVYCDINSIHRHTLTTLNNLEDAGFLDFLIVGAGKANHLTGTSAAFLDYQLKNSRTVVLGVAFQGKRKRETMAATLSIIEVPGTKVIYKGRGTEGFAAACRHAINGELPQIELSPDPPPAKRLSFDEFEALSLEEHTKWLAEQTK